MLIRGGFKLLSKYFGIYNSIRYSRIYYWILKYKNPHYIRALYQDLAFYRGVLGDSLQLVFDVGANHGDKTWAFIQIAKKVVSFEPDETSFAALRTRYRHQECVCLENVALAEKVGVGKFFVEEKGSAYNTLSEKERDWLVSRRNQKLREVFVTVSTLDQMITKYGIPDFVKIDVEGSELSVLKGLSHSVPVICFEANLPRFREETLYILESLMNNKGIRTNLRLGNDFVFSSNKPVEEIVSMLSRDEEVSYDIFIFNRK